MGVRFLAAAAASVPCKPHQYELLLTEAVTLRLVPRRKKKVRVHGGCIPAGAPSTQQLTHERLHAALQSVKWAQDVVDNEFAGKKKSKSE
jgi:hypothetical protein